MHFYGTINIFFVLTMIIVWGHSPVSFVLLLRGGSGIPQQGVVVLVLVLVLGHCAKPS